MVPASARWTPASTLMVVDLPQPLPPTKPWTVPCRSDSSARSSARVAPKRLVRPETRRTVSAPVACGAGPRSVLLMGSPPPVAAPRGKRPPGGAWVGRESDAPGLLVRRLVVDVAGVVTGVGQVVVLVHHLHAVALDDRLLAVQHADGLVDRPVGAPRGGVAEDRVLSAVVADDVHVGRVAEAGDHVELVRPG